MAIQFGWSQLSQFVGHFSAAIGCHTVVMWLANDEST